MIKRIFTLALAILMVITMTVPIFAAEAQVKNETAPKFDFSYGQALERFDLSKYSQINEFMPLLFKYMENQEYEKALRVIADKKFQDMAVAEHNARFMNNQSFEYEYAGASGKELALDIMFVNNVQAKTYEQFQCFIHYGDKIDYLAGSTTRPSLNGRGAIVGYDITGSFLQTTLQTGSFTNYNRRSHLYDTGSLSKNTGAVGYEEISYSYSDWGTQTVNTADLEKATIGNFWAGIWDRTSVTQAGKKEQVYETPPYFCTEVGQTSRKDHIMHPMGDKKNTVNEKIIYNFERYPDGNIKKRTIYKCDANWNSIGQAEVVYFDEKSIPITK